MNKKSLRDVNFALMRRVERMNLKEKGKSFQIQTHSIPKTKLSLYEKKGNNGK